MLYWLKNKEIILFFLSDMKALEYFQIGKIGKIYFHDNLSISLN